MANFLPLKTYILYCLDRLIREYGLKRPFLDVGCGIGDVAEFLGAEGWEGEAIDISAAAVDAARIRLKPLKQIRVEVRSLFDQRGSFGTVLAMDVVEHVQDDRVAFSKLASVVASGGHLVLTILTNPHEWRWDVTFPVFWAMRRMYTRIKNPPKTFCKDPETLTCQSSLQNAWSIDAVSVLMNCSALLWRPVYTIQFGFFRNCVARGHESLVLACKALCGSLNSQPRYAAISPLQRVWFLGEVR